MTVLIPTFVGTSFDMQHDPLDCGYRHAGPCRMTAAGSGIDVEGLADDSWGTLSAHQADGPKRRITSNAAQHCGRFRHWDHSLFLDHGEVALAKVEGSAKYTKRVTFRISNRNDCRRRIVLRPTIVASSFIRTCG